MGKIKVYELAKELNISNNDLIKHLKNIGIEVTSHLSALTDEQYSKAKKSINSGTAKVKKITNDEPHIIRRQVKVINTNSDKSVIDEITTSASGKVEKARHVINNTNNANNTKNMNNINSVNSNGNNSNNNPYYRNDRNRSRNGYNQRPRFNNTSNVVITRNGKPVESKNEENMKLENEEKSKMEQKDKNMSLVRENSMRENKDSSVSNVRTTTNNTNNNANNTNQYNGRNNQQTRNESNHYNNTNNYNRYNDSRRNNYQNHDGSYNRSNGYNNNSNSQNGDNRNNGYQGNRNGNNNYQNNRNGNNYQNNRNANSSYQGNNNRTGNDGYRKNQPQNSNYRYNKPRFSNNGGYNKDNTSYQVNKFIKKSAMETPAEQKDTRDYSTTLIDKKKYNSDHSNNDKKDKLNKNALREKQTRISVSKFKGLEVDELGGNLLDLYARDSDYIRKNRAKKKKSKPVMKQTKIIPMTEVELPETITVKDFAAAIKKTSSEIIKKLFLLGIMATVNQEIDFDTAFLLANDFGITAKKQVIVTDEDKLFDDSEDDEKDLKPRPPIVVVMGHVDHGKTSLLDRLRKTNVVSGEAGGITQHIGAYRVKLNNREICFLDTPGHEAFTEMRARGAQVTDIAIIVIAADDGIKPQTIEAIDHAKAAKVSIIVAINKIDKPGADVPKVKQQLLDAGLVPEEWGGDTICVPISAKTGEGIENLLEMILLVADMKNLRANPDKQAKGTILEAKLDKNVGTIASMLVQRGTLNVGDTIVVGDIIGRVRAMIDDTGKKVKKAGPSTPVEITGLPSVPQMGEIFYEVEDEKTAKHLVESRKAQERINLIKHGSKVTLNELFSKIKQGEVKELNLIIKADVQGSVEALKSSLEKLSNDEVRVNIIHASTGGIKESDVTLASVSNAIIIGFNVRPESAAKAQALKEKVDIKLYSIIYDAIDDVEASLKGMIKPTYKEVTVGECEVRHIFKISNVGTIAGCFVKHGKMLRNANARVIRDSVVIADDKISSLKREKEDAKEVAENYECGIKLEKFADIKENDIIECYEMQEEKKV